MGCTSEALQIFEQLEMWEEVVDCYRRLKQLEKAEKLVRELITKKKDEPSFYCILGDITNNLDYYKQAIEVLPFFHICNE